MVCGCTQWRMVVALCLCLCLWSCPVAWSLSLGGESLRREPLVKPAGGPRETKVLSSRDVSRLVVGAADAFGVLEASALLPLRGEETQSWEGDAVHVRKRRSALSSVLGRLVRFRARIEER